DADRSLARLQLARDQLHERRLAGAVRAEQPGDAGRDGDADVVEPDHLPVPLRQMIGGDDAHATTSTPRTRRSSTTPDAAITSATTRNETGHGVSYRGRRRKSTSPICPRFAENDTQENDVERVTRNSTPEIACVKNTTAA